MLDWLLRLFSIDTRGAGRVVEVGVGFHGWHPALVVLLAMLLGAGVFWIYWRVAENVPMRRRLLLSALRAALLALMLALLLQPVLRITLQNLARRSMLVLVDTSASMGRINDQRSDEDDIKRVAIARNTLDASKGLEQPMARSATGMLQVPRMDVVKAALKNERIDLLPRLAKDFDLSVYTFDRSLGEMPAGAWKAAAKDAPEQPELNLAWVDQLDGKGPATAIGDAIREVIARKRGQLIGGIVLVTDGAGNSGMQALDGAKLAAQDRVPLYIYGVGITSPRDIIVGKTLFAQEIAFVKDEVPVGVRVRGVGMAGQTAKLTVRLGDEKAEKDLTFTGDGEQVVSVTLKPKHAGQYDIQASIEPRDDEVVKDNNSTTQSIRIVDGKIKVLLVEQSPRWEFKYLQAILLRDPRVDCKCVLFEGDPAISRGKDTPYLPEFPPKKEDLFKYDLLVLGDVDGRFLGTAQLDMIGEFVSKFGGAMVCLAGRRAMPAAYRRTTLEKMLPVELESVDTGVVPPANRAIRLELTPSGRASPMLRLAEKDTESAAKWGQLPGIYWAQKVARAKPAADVLLVDPDPTRSSRYGKMPIIAAQQYGVGQVLYMGTDNFWRWRKNAGDRYHSTLWVQIIQRMALQHMLGGAKRTQLSTDQKEYSTGEPITFYARLYHENFEPMTDAMLPANLADVDGKSPSRQVTLRAIPEQPGMYRGQVPAPLAGKYQFTVDHDKGVKLDLMVTEPQREMAEPAMNKAVLEQMAQISGGAFFREEDLYQLPQKVTARPEYKRTTIERELWSSPFWFLLMLGLVTAEWILRKMAQLK